MSPSLIISIIAAVISAIAIGVSIWTHNRNHKLQARIVALEEVREKDRLAEKNKANLTAKITKEELRRSSTHKISWQYHLVVENKGVCGACNIKINLDGKPLLEHPTILKNIKEITQVGPNSNFRYLLGLSMQARPPSAIEIIWEDDSGEPGKYGTTLTL